MAALPLPSPIRNYLRGFVARRRRVSLVRAAGAAAAFVLVWTLLACLLDRFAQLPAWMRIGLLAVDVTVPALLLLRPLFTWCFGRMDWIAAANEVERVNPVFGQRLQTVISQLLDKSEYRGSQQILDHLLRQVADEASGQKPREAAPWRPAALPWCAALAALVATSVLMSVPSLRMPSLVRRLAHPMASIPPITTTQLTVDPEGKLLLLGQTLTIRVKASRLPDDTVDLYTSADGNKWAQNSMVPSVLNDFVFTLPAVDRDLRYYVTGGDATSPTYQVHVLRPPAVAEFRVRCEYPAYLEQAPLKVTSSEPNIEAPIGSTISLQMVSTEPLKSATLTSAQQKITMTQGNDPTLWQATFALQKDQTLNLEMQGEGGQSQRAPVTVVVRALSDRAPTVKLLQPIEDMRLHSTDTLSVQYAANDDHAIASLNAMIQVNGQKPTEKPLRLHGDPRRQEGEIQIDLGTLGVQAGDLLSVWILAQDRSDTRRGPVQSEARRILVMPPAASADVATLQRAAEMRRASQIAATAAVELAEAFKTFDAARSGKLSESERIVQVVRVNQSLTTVSDAAMQLNESLLRCIARSSSPQLSVALAGWIDKARSVVNAADRINSAIIDERWKEQAIADAMTKLANDANALVAPLAVAADAEQAAAVLSDLKAWQAMQQSPTGRGAADSFFKDLGPQVDALGAHFRSQDAVGILQHKIDVERDLVNSQSTIDFVPAAKTWVQELQKSGTAELEFSDRLEAAAVAEAVRPDSEARRTADLHLASRAAAASAFSEVHAASGTGSATSRPSLESYPTALLAMQREHELNRKPGALDGALIRTAAADARLRMNAWSTGMHVADGAAIEDLTFQANLLTVERSYDQAAALDKQIADRIAQSKSGKSPLAASDIARLSGSLTQLDRLTADQQQISADTTSTKQAAELASRQDALANEMAELEQTQLRPGEDGTGDASQTRWTAITAMRQAKDEIAVLPAQVTAALDAASSLRHAAESVQQSQQEFDSANAEKKIAAGRKLETAKKAQSDADARLKDALLQVAPARSLELTKKLAGSGADEAVAALDQKLKPGLQQLGAAIKNHDRGVIDKSIADVRAVVEQSQNSLRDAQARLFDRDPMLAARWYAHLVSAALALPVADHATAEKYQEKIAAALASASERQLQQLRHTRLASIPSLSTVLGASEEPRSTLTQSGSAPQPIASGPKRWGFLRRQAPPLADAMRPENDPPAYQDALRT